MPIPDNLIQKTVSARSSFLGEVSDFCSKNGVESTSLAEGICEIVFSLSELREEGVQLFPTVYLTTDIAALTSRLPGSSSVELGVGEPNASTAALALKQAAPLATGGWSIYLQNSAEEIRFGLFCADQVPLALSASDLLLSDGDPTDIIAIESPASSLTVLRSGRGDKIEFQFLSARGTHTSPEDEIRRFVAAATSSIPESGRESIRTYAEKLIGETLRHSHGAMLAILGPDRDQVPESLQDSVTLAEPLEFQPAIAELLERSDAQAMARLVATGQLLSGMIRSDGITLVRNDFAVLAFRAFVRLPETGDAVSAQGGARSRAFAALENLIGNDLEGVLFRSQDGRTQYTGMPNV